MLETAWNKAVENIRGVELGGASGTEAVRQAKMNTNSMAEKPITDPFLKWFFEMTE